MLVSPNIASKLEVSQVSKPIAYEPEVLQVSEPLISLTKPDFYCLLEKERPLVQDSECQPPEPDTSSLNEPTCENITSIWCPCN